VRLLGQVLDPEQAPSSEPPTSAGRHRVDEHTRTHMFRADVFDDPRDRGQLAARLGPVIDDKNPIS
jgi:hypothetical protein